MLLPKNLIASTLNTSFRKDTRGYKKGKRALPRMHVSSLIKSVPSEAFCPREFILHYIEDRDRAGAGIAPKFQLLYDTGHFIGNYLVEQFLMRNPQFRQYVYGDWTCVCGKTVVRRTTLPKDSKCTCCSQPLDRYVETDLFNKAKTVVGHADLIFYFDGVFYIYEFKSIDRADVVFADIDKPLGDHLAQASNYYYMLRDEGKRVSPIIRFVYVDRSMSNLYTTKPYKEVEAPAISIRRLAAIYKRADTVVKAMKTGILPPRICDEITCSRAKTCKTAVSCFERKLKKFKVIEQKK